MLTAAIALVLAVNGPSAVTAQATSPTSIQVNWVQSGKVTGFRVEKMVFGQNTFQFVAQLSQNVREYVDVNLTPATGYLYRIQSVKGNQRSAFTVAIGYTYTLPDLPPPTADFTISLTPSSQTITAGDSTTYIIIVGSLNGFNQAVNFNVTGLPADASFSISPSTVTGSGQANLNITTSSATPASTFGITVTGGSGTLVHSWGVQLAVMLPTCGQVIQGQRTLVATATDNVGVTAVQITLNNAPFGPALTTPPYNKVWDTTAMANGCYALGASAIDAAGNQGFAPGFTVQVAN